VIAISEEATQLIAIAPGSAYPTATSATSANKAPFDLLPSHLILMRTSGVTLISLISGPC